MSRARILLIVLSLAVGTVLMWAVVVPLNLAALRTLTGRDVRRERPRLPEDPLAQQQEIARAFRDLAPAKDAPESLQAMLNDLGNALQAGDVARVAAHLHDRRMVREFRRAGMLPDMTRREETQLLGGLKTGLARGLAVNGPMMGWGNTDVRSVKFLPDGEAVVIARHRSAFNVTAKMRWWLTRADGVWQIYDFEDLDTGLRISTLMAALLPVRPAGMPPWVAAAPQLQQLITALRQGDLQDVERQLAQLEKVALPAQLDAVRWMIAGAAKSGLGRYRDALPCLDRARQLNPDMPCLDHLYGAVYVQLGRPRDALDHLKKYGDLLGEDGDLSFQMGLALSRLGRAPEAAAAFRKTLDEQANANVALLELRRVLPRGGKQELTARYARLPQAHEYFEELAGDALMDRDSEAVAAYVAVLRGRNTNDPVVDFCEARAKALAGEFEPALALFKKATTNMPAGGPRTNYVRAFLDDVTGTGESLRVYRLVPDRREAFPLLAGALFVQRDDDGLRALIAAHREVYKDDPWLHFYAGEQYAEARQYDEADRAFAAAQAGAADDPARERFRARRVFVRYQAGKALSAYEEIGPRHATFAQLAGLFAQPRHRKELEALIAAHRRHEPGDPKLPLWEAEAAWLAQDHATSVRLLQAHRNGAFADPNRRFQFTNRLLRGLARLGRLDEVRKEAEGVIRRGAAERPDLRDTLRNLVYERQTEAVAALAAALRAAAPDDPEGLAWQARAEILRGRLDEAGVLLRSAMQRQQNAPVRDQYQREILYDTVDARKPLEGYRIAPDPDFAFRVLADGLLNRDFERPLPDDDRDDDDFDDAPRPPGMPAAEARAALRLLIAAHREKRPADAAPHLYAGELHRREGAIDKALDAFARGMAANPAPDLRQRFHYDQVRAFYQTGKVLAAYTDLGRDRQTFNELANLCVHDRKVKDLAALVAAHRQNDPNDAALPVWEAESCFVAGDYAGALRLLERHRNGVFKEPNHQWKFKDRLVRCLVRLKRFDEALKQAQAFARERNGNPLLPAVVHAAAGDVAKTRTALEACQRRYYNAVTFYADPDLGPALVSEPFRAVRQRFPERLPLPRSEQGQLRRRF